MHGEGVEGVEAVYSKVQAFVWVHLKMAVFTVAASQLGSPPPLGSCLHRQRAVAEIEGYLQH